jgi:hypothetical protein
MRSGYFVAETADAVYLGTRGMIVAYPQERVRELSVRGSSRRKAIRSRRSPHLQRFLQLTSAGCMLSGVTPAARAASAVADAR